MNIVAYVMGFVLLLSACGQSDRLANGNFAAQPDVGSEVYVHGLKPWAFMATSEQAYEALCEAANADDEYGLRNLLMIGGTRQIDNGTKVRVIGRSLGRFPGTRVRVVTSGKYENHVGWFNYKNLNPKPPR